MIELYQGKWTPIYSGRSRIALNDGWSWMFGSLEAGGRGIVRSPLDETPGGEGHQTVAACPEVKNSRALDTDVLVPILNERLRMRIETWNSISLNN
jgi:hypothetical protein